jgi:tRNA pseudouridine55 synthase
MFYLIHKPLWITSFDVIRKLRKILCTKKIWHTGTLDPLATWCLLIATDNSTKLIPLLEKLEKSYTFKVRIDGTTPSLDLGTEILYHKLSWMFEHSSQELAAFLSEQSVQIPPAYSALKVDWIRSYELARKWEKVLLKERSIRIRNITIHTYEPPEFEISLQITSGWYIRSLAQSIGEFFWLPGWYITNLRRDILHTDWTTLSLNDAQDLESFDPNKFISYERLFPYISVEEVDTLIYTKIQQWKIIDHNELSWAYNIWQKIFIKYEWHITSLLEYSSIGFQIIRNNI